MPKPSTIILDTWNQVSSGSSNLSLKKEYQLAKDIIKKLQSTKDKKIKRLGEKLKLRYQLNKDHTTGQIMTLIDLINPENKVKSQLNISNNQYQQLIRKKQNNQINKLEEKELQQALLIKICSCLKQKTYQSTYQWLLGKRTDELDSVDDNPYAICTASIYNKRGFKRTYSLNKCRELTR